MKSLKLLKHVFLCLVICGLTSCVTDDQQQAKMSEATGEAAEMGEEMGAEAEQAAGASMDKQSANCKKWMAKKKKNKKSKRYKKMAAKCKKLTMGKGKGKVKGKRKRKARKKKAAPAEPMEETAPAAEDETNPATEDL